MQKETALNPQEVVKIGRRLYGRAWNNRLASALGVEKSTVSRWARGLVPVSPSRAMALRLLLDKHKLRKLAA